VLDRLERRRLGTSGLDVPVVGMGTWKTFDVRGQQAASDRRIVVDVALEHGSNLFDSSPMYGAAEQVLGAGLHGRREQALVATKVWTPDDAEAEIERSLMYFGGLMDLMDIMRSGRISCVQVPYNVQDRVVEERAYVSRLADEL
jgi:diketogulonate reductase-like aldo/keto reductase